MNQHSLSCPYPEGCDCNAPLLDELDRLRSALSAAKAERDESRGERDFFDAERIKVAMREEEILAELDSERAKVALLMQPVPETQGDFPWQMMRLWTLTRDEEKLAERVRIRELIAERDLALLNLDVALKANTAANAIIGEQADEAKRLQNELDAAEENIEALLREQDQ